MTPTQKNVVLLSLVKCLEKHGSWCGETHIQKATFFVQELLGVPLNFEFVLFKHGPYSFELKEGLTSNMADGLLSAVPRPPYGPSLALGANASNLLQRFPKTRDLYNQQTEFVASRLGSKGIVELERLATALYVTRRELPDGNDRDRAERVHQLKPHIPRETALEAVAVVDGLINEVAQIEPTPA
ncbi:hypothetical protein [Gemmata sp.]|uniref:hypothetical protein n=1 Tax=Gemmata sp. TaxID=1914242 RepID=UPI003F71735F